MPSSDKESKPTTPPHHISIDVNSAEGHDVDSPKSGLGTPRSSSGWDGKLRIEKKNNVELVNPEAISDPEYSDEENVAPGEIIEADEGELSCSTSCGADSFLCTKSNPLTIFFLQSDLLDDYPEDTTEIDAIHARISSIPSLKLTRFPQLARLCLRQNAIAEIEELSPLSKTLKELDLYDNLIAHIRGLEDLTNLTSLDLSFNKIKHIKKISHLTNLTDLYFVQNKIATIENLNGLTKLRNLELAANRIREIQNLETLTGLEELWLGKNKILEIKNISALTNLKILSIQSNRIRNISGLSSLPQLEELYISHNALTSLSGLENSTSLRVLDISNNQIASLAGIGHLEELEELWASYNQVGDFMELERELAGKKKLNTVYFEGCPLQLKGPAVYRNKVRLTLPQVMQIDASKFSFLFPILPPCALLVWSLTLRF